MLEEKDMNDKDLRVIKTKKALTSSLYALLEIEPFSSITVHKICENAGIHRTTFYKHFYDKYELLVYLLEVIGKITLQLILRNVLIVRFKFCLIH